MPVKYRITRNKDDPGDEDAISPESGHAMCKIDILKNVLILAFSYRCTGHPEEWKFLVVYWLAPMVGIAAAWETWMGVGKAVNVVKGKQE